VCYISFFSQGGPLIVGLMPVLAACHLIYVSSIVCIVFLYMFVANSSLSFSPVSNSMLLELKGTEEMEWGRDRGECSLKCMSVAGLHRSSGGLTQACACSDSSATLFS